MPGAARSSRSRAPGEVLLVGGMLVAPPRGNVDMQAATCQHLRGNSCQYGPKWAINRAECQHTAGSTCRQGRRFVSDPRNGEGTLAEQLYRKLGDAILAGDLAPGAKINEPALARHYGVSRGPLREALHRLQERKLVTRSANQGPRVVKPSAEVLAELFVVREALEGMAARLAAINATDAEIVQL